MQVSLYTNSQYQNNKNYINNILSSKAKYKNINFTSKPLKPIEIIEQQVTQAAKGSNFFEPVKKLYGKMTDWLAKNVISHVIENKYVFKFADRFKNNDMLYNHMLAVGSLITSGLYVKRTLDNKDFDKDRRRTLAINQVLTFIISTIGAYSLDTSLNKWWNNITNKYVAMHIGDNNFIEAINKETSKIAQENKKIKELNKNLDPANRTALKHIPTTSEFLKKYVKENPNIQIGSKELSLLNQKVSGLSLLKKMVVFGMVYRFLVPVLVTPFANKLGDMAIARRQRKEAEKSVGKA